MDRLFVTIKWALVGWGAVSLVFYLWSLTIFLASFSVHASTKSSQEASLNRFHMVLDNSGLGANRIEGALQVYEKYPNPVRALHFHAYASKMAPVDMNDLTQSMEGSDIHWYRGNHLPSVVDNAVTAIGQATDELQVSWFPKTQEIRSDQIYVYSWNIDYAGVKPIEATLIFVRPSDQMVFYADFK